VEGVSALIMLNVLFKVQFYKGIRNKPIMRKLGNGRYESRTLFLAHILACCFLTLGDGYKQMPSAITLFLLLNVFYNFLHSKWLFIKKTKIISGNINSREF
jgi:hypothetical protein